MWEYINPMSLQNQWATTFGTYKILTLHPNVINRDLVVTYGWFKSSVSSSSAERSKNAADSRYPVISCLTAPTSATDSLWDRSWDLDCVDEVAPVSDDAVDVECSGFGVVVLLIDKSVGAEIFCRYYTIAIAVTQHKIHNLMIYYIYYETYHSG